MPTDTQTMTPATPAPLATTDTASPFEARVVEETLRRTNANPCTDWLRLSPTDPRSPQERERAIDRGAMVEGLFGASSLMGGVFGGLGLGVFTQQPVVFAAGIAAGLGGFFWAAFSIEDGRIPRLSRRYRQHVRLMADSFLVPRIAADAYDTITQAPTMLASLSAPDAAVEYAVNAREAAADALTELGRLADVDEDLVWLATTDPYRRLVALASEVTVLAHISRDRLALPATHRRPIPTGLTRAADVGAYMLDENTHVAGVLDPAPAENPA